MIIVSKVLLISSTTVIVRAGGAIWLNYFAMVLSTVLCSRCRVLCFVPVLRGCVWYVCCYVRQKVLLQCLCKYCERRDMGLNEVPLYMSLLGFGMGTMLANFHMGVIMLVLRAVFNMLVRIASP